MVIMSTFKGISFHRDICKCSCAIAMEFLLDSTRSLSTVIGYVILS